MDTLYDLTRAVQQLVLNEERDHPGAQTPFRLLALTCLQLASEIEYLKAQSAQLKSAGHAFLPEKPTLAAEEHAALLDGAYL